MQKLFKYIRVGIILVIIIVFFIFLYTKINKSFTEIIDQEWSIKLPNSYKEIYTYDSGPSLQGDGEDRYHILQYTKENDINQSVKWENSKNKYIETEIDKFLEMLNVSTKDMPSFKKNYKYYTKMQDDNSEIYLIFIPDTKKLYVIEDLMHG